MDGLLMLGAIQRVDVPNWLYSWAQPFIVKRWSELHIDFATATGPENMTAVTSSNKVNIHIDGVFAGAIHSVWTIWGYSFIGARR